MTLDSPWANLETRIGYEFADQALLRQALTHASGADHRLLSNERLEFLGDAILGAAVCETLFRRFPDYLEGDLTRVKSVVVSRQTCCKISEELGLDEFLILGKGIRPNRIPDSVMADALEALIAAIFLDGGAIAARSFIARFVEPELRGAAAAAGENYKSLLQHVAQRDHGGTPVYRVTNERGPDHQKSFQVRAVIGGQSFDAAWGQSKKEAEQRAAMNALYALSELEAATDVVDDDALDDGDDVASDGNGTAMALGKRRASRRPARTRRLPATGWRSATTDADDPHLSRVALRRARQHARCPPDARARDSRRSLQLGDASFLPPRIGRAGGRAAENAVTLGVRRRRLSAVAPATTLRVRKRSQSLC